ncbi:hypothetical protein LNKW23_29540 [Paralimibaculum aggregatum]|uniref:Uncharacterized protein n=1 Tax=Paralimibaculum aggregatum TaxID=3036245 RepID=A0ABQ6LMP9_9RHOB|nr:hypothetical protein [Limibaculum sp. NKW23]GMG83741.1 hypothetical protein LNKW23_29540 [Limibaculum sp. NKW23]
MDDPAPDSDAAPAAIEIPAELGPAEAGAVRDALLAGLGRADAAGAALSIEIGPGTLLPCALQLLAAARASAAARGTPLDLGPRAAAALAPGH